MFEKAFGVMGDIGMGMMASVGNVVMDRAAAGVAGAISNGIDKINNRVENALGKVFGVDFSGALSNSWLARASKRHDPHLQLDWNIIIPGIDAAYVEEVQAPVADFESAGGVFRGGQQMFYAGAQSISPMNIKFYEDQRFTTSQFLASLRDSIATNGMYNYPSEYKIKIVVMATNVLGGCVAQFVYEGCWPSKIPNYTFGSDSSERTTITIDFNVDTMYVIFPGGLGDMFGLGRLTDFANGLTNNIAGSIAGGVGTALGSGALRLGTKIFG